MRRIIVAIVCLISLSLLTYLLTRSRHGEAQAFDHALRGLAKIEILVEDLDSNSMECGLTKDGVRNAVLYPTSSAKFQVTDSAPVMLYVNALSHFFEPQQLCVTNVEMQAYSNEVVTLDFSGRKVFSAIQLWRKGYLASSNQSEHARLVAEAIDNLAKEFVTAWNLDNKITPAAEANPFAKFAKPERATTTDIFADLRPAEIVSVKYRGPVDLAPFSCETVTRSSFIQRVCYDEKNTYMLINLSGTWYHHCEIDPATVASLLNAESMPSFYNMSIKGNFDFDCRTHRAPAY
jgi:KTSC domain